MLRLVVSVPRDGDSSKHAKLLGMLLGSVRTLSETVRVSPGGFF
jgi:hypothetical protein